MCQEKTDKIVLKYSKPQYPGRATEKQVMYINSLLSQGYLFKSDFISFELIDADMLLFCRADQLIKLGLSRKSQAGARGIASPASTFSKNNRETQKMSDNSKTADKAVAEEQRKFLEAVEKLTTLRQPEIVALASIYGLSGFFQKYSQRIIERKLGETIAEVVLSILKLRSIRIECRESIYKTASANPKLSAGLRSWLIDQSIGEPVVSTECKRPAPVPAPVPAYVANKHDGWAEVVSSD